MPRKLANRKERQPQYCNAPQSTENTHQNTCFGCTKVINAIVLHLSRHTLPRGQSGQGLLMPTCSSVPKLACAVHHEIRLEPQAGQRESHTLPKSHVSKRYALLQPQVGWCVNQAQSASCVGQWSVVGILGWL